MIEIPEVVSLIQSSIPDAKVEVIDKNGMRDHYIIMVASKAFEGSSLMDRHRRVMACLEPAMRDGRLHAAEIRTEVIASTAGN